MNKNAALSLINSIFSQYMSLTPADNTLLSALKDGKLYEIYVLSELLTDLHNRGFRITPPTGTLKFKAAPGMIKFTDPHFTIRSPSGGLLWLFVNIEFQTLGSEIAQANDLSDKHELDIALVDIPLDILFSQTAHFPTYDHVYLAVECKNVAKFRKNYVREALGVRRELSYLSSKQDSSLTVLGGYPHVTVPAEPPSEFWLAFTHIEGQGYKESPAAFGVSFKHIEP